VVDNSDIGESALPNALPWDTIPPAPYFTYQDFSKILPGLRDASQKRQAADPDFQYLNDEIAFAKTMKDKTAISLNEVKRRDEQKQIDDARLAMENHRRTAKGQVLLKTGREIEDQEDKDAQDDITDPNKEKPEDEAFVTEAANILLDSEFATPPAPPKAAAQAPDKSGGSWWN